MATAARAMLTTSQVASAIGCATGSVQRLVDDGAFPGAYRFRGQRRIPIDGVRAYCQKHGLPFPPEFDRRPATTVLTLGMRDADLRSFVLAVPEAGVFIARSVFDAGGIVARLRVLHAAVLDARQTTRDQVLAHGRELRDQASGLRLIGITAEDDGSLQKWVDAGFDTVLTPASYGTLAATLAKEIRGIKAW